MATGDVVIAREGDVALQQIRGALLLDPEKACAEALAAYLRRQTFTIWGGESTATDLTRNRSFQFSDVLDDYPDAQHVMVYPTASIIPRQSVEYGESFTPSAIESTWNEATGSVLWKLGVATGVFQVDMWADSKPLRDAMAAEIARVLSPRESMTGVLLRLPETYACATGRFTLTGLERINLPNKAFTNEWELRALVSWDALVLDLRGARRFLPRAEMEIGPAVETAPAEPRRC